MSGLIKDWLEGLGLGQYFEIFQENAIDLDILPELTEADLKDLGVKLGDRKRVLRAISNAQPRRQDEDFEQGKSPQIPSESERSARDLPEAERRQLTVVFCDLVGSTALAGSLDPEDMSALLRTYRESCARVIERWGGQIAKFMGDGVLAYFGYPRAREDDAERAVRAAIELTRATAGLPSGSYKRLAARVGIATGRVVVGELIGEGTALEHTVVGETPNLAARLQALADPGAVVISEGTRNLLARLFEFQDLGTHDLKGFNQPVRAWQVTGEGDVESRFEATRRAKLTPLTGREEELEILSRRWQRAKTGEGQVVLVSGEAGIGKSRIVQALCDNVAGEPHTRLRYQCSSFHTNTAFYPEIEQFQRVAGFTGDEDPADMLDKMEAVLALSGRPELPVAPLFASLLSIPFGDRYPPLQMTPQRQKEETILAMLDQLEGLTGQDPVLFVFEDAHWIDPSSLELLERVVDCAKTLPLLVLITFRPDFVAPWSGNPHVTTLTLNRLSSRIGEEIIVRLTGGKSLPPEVVEQIVEQTDGVPLYLEELTKSILESGQLEEAAGRYILTRPLSALAIPATLQDSLMARLDRLAPVKEVAQIGAAIGRTFSFELLRSVARMDTDHLHDALDDLVGSELVVRRRSGPEATYTFKHGLVREIAYRSLLKSRRQQLHADIADALEKKFPRMVEQDPAMLAHHLSEGGMTERAADFYEQAGRLSVMKSASKEAAAHFKRALAEIRKLPITEQRMRREVSLLTALGGALVNATGLASDELEQAYVEARELCNQLGETQQQFVAEWGLWHVYLGRAQYREAAPYADSLIMKAEEIGDSGFQLQALHADWSNRIWSGDFSQVIETCDRGWKLYARKHHDDQWLIYGGHDAGVCSRNMGSLALSVQGKKDQAKTGYEDGLALARDIDRPAVVAHALNWGLIVFQIIGDHDRLESQAEEALELARDQATANYFTDATIVSAWLRGRQGDPRDAVQAIQNALEARRERGTLFLESYYLALLAETLGRQGAVDEALKIVTDGIRFVERTGERWVEPELYRLRGTLLPAVTSNNEEAEGSLLNAFRLAERLDAKTWQLRAAVDLAKFWQRQGKVEQAHELLAPTCESIAEGFDTPDYIEAKALLAEFA